MYPQDQLLKKLLTYCQFSRLSGCLQTTSSFCEASANANANVKVSGFNPALRRVRFK